MWVSLIPRPSPFVAKRHTVVVVQCENVSAHTSGKRGKGGGGVRDGAWLSN